MSRLPPDTVALRQVVIVGLLAFVVGMASVLIFMSWLMWRFVEPDTPWHELLHVSVEGLIFGVIGGLAFAAGATSLLRWWQFRRGVYHCEH